MSRPIRGGPAALDVRALLLAKYRESAARYSVVHPAGPVRAPFGGFYRAPYGGVVAALEAGRPVSVYCWELPREARAGFHISDRIVVAADGSLRREDRSTH